MNKFIVILFTLLLSSSFGQDCDRVLFRGKVSDTLRPQSFYNLMVINKSTGRGVFGQPNGSFSVYASPGDSISLSCKGYPVITRLVVADSNCQHIAFINIEGNAQDVAEVEVRPLKSLAQIKEERSTLAMRETRMVTGIEVLQSPITALYQTFSKKERSKRTVAEWEHQDNQNRIVQELLRTYVAFDIIDLTPAEFEEFVDFLNIDENFLKTASEMELITFIQDKFEHYLLVKGLN